MMQRVTHIHWSWIPGLILLNAVANKCVCIDLFVSRSTIGVTQSTISAAMSSSGKKLAVIKPNEIDVWNLVEWKVECEVVSDDKEEFCSAEFSNQEEYLFVIKISDPALYVWQIARSAQLPFYKDGIFVCNCR